MRCLFFVDKVKSEALYFLTVRLIAENALTAERIIFNFVFETNHSDRE